MESLSIPELREFFDLIDVDHSGKLEKKEVQQLFRKFNRVITPKELNLMTFPMSFEDFIQIINPNHPKIDEIRQLFDLIDEDKNGSLDKEEILQLSTKFGLELTENDLTNLEFPMNFNSFLDLMIN